MHDLYCRNPEKGECADCKRIAAIRADQDSLTRLSKIVREQTHKAFLNGYERGRLDERAGAPHLAEA
jgi:hypothetical protein